MLKILQVVAMATAVMLTPTIGAAQDDPLPEGHYVTYMEMDISDVPRIVMDTATEAKPQASR